MIRPTQAVLPALGMTELPESVGVEETADFNEISHLLNEETSAVLVNSKNGLNIIRKVFGVILMAIAVKLFASNINQLFAHGI